MNDLSHRILNNSKILNILTFSILTTLTLLNSCTKNNLEKKPVELHSSSIVNGKRVKPGHFNGVVLIETQINNSVSYCSGSLIDEKTIITAGHCVLIFGDKEDNAKYVKNTKVIIGSGAIGEKHHVFNVSYAKAHPEYILSNKGASFSGIDIAYIKLSKPVPASIATPIPVLSKYESKQFLTSGSDILMMGFGKTEYGTMILKKFAWSKISLVNDPFFTVTEHNNTGVCSGDSGGPSFIQLPNEELRLASVTSSVMGRCNGPHIASLMSDISYGVDFIEADSLRLEAERLEAQLQLSKAMKLYSQIMDLVSYCPEVTKKYKKLVDDMNNKGLLSSSEVKASYERFNQSMITVHENEGNIEEAISYALKTEEYPKKDLKLATLYNANSQAEKAYQHAKRYADRMETKGVVDFYTYKVLGTTALVYGKDPAAREAFQKALRIKPNSPNIYLMYATVFYYEKKYNQVIEYLDRYFEIIEEQSPRSFPEPKAYNLYIGTLRETKGSQEKAQALLDLYYEKLTKSLVIKIENAYYFNDSNAFSNGLSKLASVNPDNLNLLVFTATLSLISGDTEQALKIVNQGLDRVKDTTQFQRNIKADLLNLKGICHSRNKEINYIDLIKAFKDALKLQPNHQKANENLFRIYLSMGLNLEAEILINAKIASNPTFYDYKLRAELYLTTRNYDKALKDLDKILEFDAANIDAYFSKTLIYYLQGKDSIAKRMAQDIIAHPTASKEYKVEAQNIIDTIAD